MRCCKGSYSWPPGCPTRYRHMDGCPSPPPGAIPYTHYMPPRRHTTCHPAGNPGQGSWTGTGYCYILTPTSARALQPVRCSRKKEPRGPQPTLRCHMEVPHNRRCRYFAKALCSHHKAEPAGFERRTRCKQPRANPTHALEAKHPPPPQSRTTPDHHTEQGCDTAQHMMQRQSTTRRSALVR